MTVSGVGYIFAYVSNSRGDSQTSWQYVNGVELVLNEPTISSKYLDYNLWVVALTQNQASLDGNPQASIYYKIGDGEATLYNGEFTISNGTTFTMWAQAEGYTTSPVVTVTAQSEPEMSTAWSESYTYLNTQANMELGTEVEPGLYNLTYNGNKLQEQHLLTPDDNMGSGF